MYRIEKSFRFEAAHQLLPGCFSNACSDCIHGHSYKCTVVLESIRLDRYGMVLDFGVLKGFIESIRKEYDHGVLLPGTIARRLKAIDDDPASGLFGTQKKIVDFGCNPTAENIACQIGEKLCDFLSNEWPGVKVVGVRVQETETGLAEWRP